MKIVTPLNGVKVFKCDEDTARMLFEKLSILPVNEFYSETLAMTISVFILSKKLEKFIKENNMEVKYE